MGDMARSAVNVSTCTWSGSHCLTAVGFRALQRTPATASMAGVERFGTGFLADFEANSPFGVLRWRA